MINKLLNILFVLLLGVFSLYLIQGACFRLVEPYAKLRLGLAWGSSDTTKMNSIISKLPLDHFAQPPIKEGFDIIKEELAYARKIMSFNRPARDRYYNYVRSQVDPLRNFEITNLGMVKEVVLPGLRRPATSLDVANGLARRESLPVDFSKALFVRVIPQTSRLVYEQSFGQWEKAFAFLLNHGISCVLLSPKNSEELSTQLSYLQAQHSNFCENIFAYAEGQAVGLLDNAVNGNEEISLRCLIVKDPSEEVLFNEHPNPVWFMGITSQVAADEQVLLSMTKRAQLYRDSPLVFHSRLSGLIYEESKWENLALTSFPMSYILNCLEFYPDSLPFVHEVKEMAENNVSSSLAGLGKPSQEIGEISSLSIDDFEYSNPEPNFDCEVVREYRQINKGDAGVADLTNRELVLQIGSSFEEMGVNVLEQIADQDPMFYRFYLSLKEIGTSQN